MRGTIYWEDVPNKLGDKAGGRERGMRRTREGGEKDEWRMKRSVGYSNNIVKIWDREGMVIRQTTNRWSQG